MNTKKIFLAYSYANCNTDFRKSMRIVAQEIALLPDVVINHAGQYPEVPESDVLWRYTYAREIHEANLVIVVLDHHSSALVDIMRTVLQAGKHLWCFFPRGTIVHEDFSRTMTCYFSPAFNGVDQRIFPYDAPSNIVSMVGSMFPEPILERKTDLVPS